MHHGIICVNGLPLHHRRKNSREKTTKKRIQVHVWPAFFGYTSSHESMVFSSKMGVSPIGSLPFKWSRHFPTEPWSYGRKRSRWKPVRRDRLRCSTHCGNIDTLRDQLTGWKMGGLRLSRCIYFLLKMGIPARNRYVSLPYLITGFLGGFFSPQLPKP